MSRFPECEDPSVAAGANAVLAAIATRWQGPAPTMNKLGREASLATSDIEVTVVSVDFGHNDTSGKGISWIMAKHQGETSEVVLLLPRWIHHSLRPHWEGLAKVVLIGSEASVADAVRVLSDLSQWLLAAKSLDALLSKAGLPADYQQAWDVVSAPRSGDGLSSMETLRIARLLAARLGKTLTPQS